MFLLDGRDEASQPNFDSAQVGDLIDLDLGVQTAAGLQNGAHLVGGVVQLGEQVGEGDHQDAEGAAHYSGEGHQLPVLIPGQSYIRVSEGIHDPLCITVLCVDGGEGSDPVFFVSVDISSLYHVYIDEVQDAVAKKNPNIPRHSIIMNSTHTHTAMALHKTPEKSPDGVEIYPGLEYLKVFADLASDAICEAWDTRSEGGMSYGYG